MEFLLNIKNTLLPEAVLVAIILICSVLSFVLNKEKQSLIFHVSYSGVILALVSFLFLDYSLESRAFFDSMISNNFTIVFRSIILLGSGITLLLSKDYVKNFGKSTGEFYCLILIATLGALLLTGANDLIMIFIGLETLSIASFALCGYTKLDKLSNEAALKYLIIGAASTAVTLYGFSFLYGMTGQTNLAEISQVMCAQEPNLMMLTTFILILGGFGFKLSMFPFHAWTPDVYQGAPIPVAAFLSVVSKAAGFAILIRFMTQLFSDLPLFSVIIATFAILTMTIGNFMAIGQENIRRLLAYSSIAQAGYILLGLAILTTDGISAITFYLITYLFMNFGTWTAIEMIAGVTGKDRISDYKGLANKHRYFALGLAICLLSLAGIPLTAGFLGKFYLFKAVATAGYNFMPTLIIALVNTVLAVYYYLKVIKAMYVSEPEAKPSVDINNTPMALRAVLALTVAGVIFIGFYASPFIELAEKSSESIKFKKNDCIILSSK